MPPTLFGIPTSFLDNIAAAMIGGTVAATVFKGKLHIGYIAAIVAASNAGGAGSVLGDTSTMMWIDGVDPVDVLHAYVAAGTALVGLGFPGLCRGLRRLDDLVRIVGGGGHLQPVSAGSLRVRLDQRWMAYHVRLRLGVHRLAVYNGMAPSCVSQSSREASGCGTPVILLICILSD